MWPTFEVQVFLFPCTTVECSALHYVIQLIQGLCELLEDYNGNLAPDLARGPLSNLGSVAPT